MADWTVALLKYLGMPVTRANRNFLSTWARWEGGHTNNDATYNWLNTTRNTVGAVRSINSVGVKAFDTFENGIAGMGDTITNGRYPDIISALQSGNPFRYKPVAGLSTWLSGSPNSSSGRAYASKVLGTKAPAPVPGATRKEKGIPKMDDDSFGWGDLAKVIFDDDPEMQAIFASWDEQPDASGPELQYTPTTKKGGVVGFAKSQLGLPYKFGTAAPGKSFDCSGLIQWAYGQVGISLPHNAAMQMKYGHGVKWGELAPGDLIFPNSGHVVMYVGDGKVIAAPRTGTVVQLQDVNNFKNPAAIRRILP